MKQGFISAVVLAALLCFSQVAQAALSTDRQYMVVFQRGITWADAAKEVAGWGDSFQLATIDSLGEKRYLQSLLSGLRGEFWIGGYQSSSDQPLWLAGNRRVYSYWAKWEPIDYFGPASKGHPVVSNHYGSKHDGYDRGWDDWKWNQWAWNDGRRNNGGWDNGGWHDGNWKWNGKAEPPHISGFIVEKLEPRGPTTPTPVPPAVWLLGSGLAAMGIARASRRQRTS